MKIRTIATLALTAVGAFAGETIQEAEKPENNGDWCDRFDSLSQIYKDKKNPYIQEIELYFRAHYQFGYTDGDNLGQNFSGHGGEFRRFRVGAAVEFLDGFKLVGRINVEEGGYRDDKIGYDGFDQLYLEYDFGDVGVFDNVTLGYGRYKIDVGGEEHNSSAEIKTVERSNLNNFFAPDRSTGFTLEAEYGDAAMTFGVFTTDEEEALADWNAGTAYFASVDFDLGKDHNLILDFLYNDTNPASKIDSIGYEWAASVTHLSEIGDIDLFLNATYGRTHGGNDVYGFVVMPSTELIKNKLEAVVRYQYANADARVFEINKRNVDNVADADGVGIGAGDLNHTIYAGLNYFLCEDHAKFQIGAEYETLTGRFTDVEATTLWAAFKLDF
ncbi:OprO/OprP family phosphate-selective porin [Akkermansiaceae bacterium]|nr:OprO/OprP family phosphate-selective porin [Akkermansiaceae bacterium]MDB4262477.1 OprO/OprP family phosphate-selective porin [bacterium]MDB4041557.1 OprO/OprP family phosphate-selective porin [Akkermansiaceae bacterium]MDB4275179.1 OprO/OprP family phosphate-selective porin [Akkermansiaceae bacterium]MDB4275854.1 OprO/OprP family phosphate-selective porin [Akkermansiaceae bacterium]